MGRQRTPVTLPAEPTSDTIPTNATPIEGLLKPELIKLLHTQNAHIEMLVNTIQNKEEQLKAKEGEEAKHIDEMNHFTKTAENVIRSMHTYQEDRIKAIFQIMNSVQVLFKDPNYKEEE